MTSRGVASVILAVYLTVLALAVIAGARGASQSFGSEDMQTPKGDSAIRCLAATTITALALSASAAPRGSSNYIEARRAIYAVFGPYAAQAMRVAGCETGRTYDPRAQNGIYLGIFQMGSSERARYGHGPSWLEQARAAYRYFVAAGYSWRPWTCRWAA